RCTHENIVSHPWDFQHSAPFFVNRLVPGPSIFLSAKNSNPKTQTKTGASDATNLHFVKRLSRHFLGRAGMRNSGYYTSHSGLAFSDRGQAHTHLAISC